MNELVRSDRRLTVRMMAEELNINRLAPFCWRSSTCAKCAPRLCPSFCQTTRSSIMSGFAKTCSSELEQIQISLAASSLETNLGYSSMTRKPRGRASSRQPQIHHDPRKRARRSRKSRPCWSLSSWSKGFGASRVCASGPNSKSSTASTTGFTVADQLFGKTMCGSCWPTIRSQC